MERIQKSFHEKNLELENSLSDYATKSSSMRGRENHEAMSPVRTEFQRDRDRITHCLAFRRLKHKTQVFLAPKGDHYTTRLTHTLEVSQISRTVARALRLNEDLVEAIALGHDMGHTPFGHTGESVLNHLNPHGFHHRFQSVRIIEQIEKNGRGLNLTWEVRNGIKHHSKPRGEFLSNKIPNNLSLEAQIVRLCDSVAYLNHDLLDAFRAGVLNTSDIPPDIFHTLGSTHSERINSMVIDIIESSSLDTPNPSSKPKIQMSEQISQSLYQLREFMFEQVYLPQDGSPAGDAARSIVELLYDFFQKNPTQIPEGILSRSENKIHAISDYISGMTDHFAIRTAEKINPGISKPLTLQEI
ncbi:MAG: deoxyguanosinetriphosphate triphosphohydrolase [Dehalococcoidia bacterium]